jgi:hypothetical protein
MNRIDPWRLPGLDPQVESFIAGRDGTLDVLRISEQNNGDTGTGSEGR